MSVCPFSLKEINSNHHASEAYADAMESHGHAFRTDDLGGYVAVLGYAEVRQAAANHSGLCSGEGATIPSLGLLRAIPTETDLPEHREYRRMLQPELRPEPVRGLEQRMREIADEAIDEMIEHGKGDLRALAERLPAVMIAEVLGFPDRGGDMLRMADQLNRSAGDSADDANTARLAFFAFVDELVTIAENDPAFPGLLGTITRTEINGARLTHEELVRTGISLVLAGHETTVNGISSALWLIGSHPETKQRLLEDRSKVPLAVEEALRLESPISMMGRTATEPIELAGVTVEPGEKVGLFFGAANLDPEKYSDPDQFDIDRPSMSHLAFGHGIHRCVGEHLARSEMRVAIEQVLDRMPDFVIAGPVEVGSNFAMNRGLMSLPITFTAAQRVGTPQNTDT